MEQNPCKPICERLNQIPPLLWIALATLVLMVVGKALYYLRGDQLSLLEAVLAGVLLFGIYQKRGWAYWLTFLFVLLEVVLGTRLHKHRSEGVFEALVINLLILVPVVLRRDYFPMLWAPPAYSAQQWSSPPPPPESKDQPKSGD